MTSCYIYRISELEREIEIVLCNHIDLSCLLRLYLHLLCSHGLSKGDKSRNAGEDCKKERGARDGKAKAVHDSPSKAKLGLGFVLTCN